MNVCKLVVGLWYLVVSIIQAQNPSSCQNLYTENSKTRGGWNRWGRGANGVCPDKAAHVVPSPRSELFPDLTLTL